MTERSMAGTGKILSVTHPNETGSFRNAAYTYDRLHRTLTEVSAGVTQTYTYDKAGNYLTAQYGGTVQISGGGGTEIAAAVIGITLFSGGSGYSSVPTVAITGGGGTGATAVADIAAVITAIALTNPGSGYTSTPVVAITGGGGSGAIAGAVTSGKVTGITVLDGGMGYAFAPSVLISGGGGSGATALASVTLSNVSSINLTSTGSGYSTPPMVSITGGGGTGATAAAAIAGAVTGPASTVVTQYVYDKGDNRTQAVVTGGSAPGTTTYTIGNGGNGAGANQIIMVTPPSGPSISYLYDANGNRIRAIGAPVDNFAYDYENRLTSVYLGGGLYTYQYDYRTRRVMRTEVGDETQITYCGGVSIMEFEPGNAGSPNVEYIRGPDQGGGVGGLEYGIREGTSTFNLYNSRGDVVAQSSGPYQWVMYSASYDAFGNILAEEGLNLDRQRANTKEQDPTGFINDGSRYRDPVTGTFITRDPAGLITMQPVEKWYVHGREVTFQEYNYVYTTVVPQSGPDKTTRTTGHEVGFHANPDDEQRYHSVIPGEPNTYIDVKNNPWTLFDPEGLDPQFRDSYGNAMPGRGVDISLHSQSVTSNPRSNPRNAWSDNKTFTVMGHGYGEGVVPPFMADQRGLKKGDDTGPTVPRLSPTQLASIIKKTPNWSGSITSVILYSCETGMGGDKSFAEQLAKRLKVPVWAPTDRLDYGSKYHGKDAPPGQSTGIEHGGSWQEFKPPQKKPDKQN